VHGGSQVDCVLFGRSLRLVDVEATELFVGPVEAPLQVVRVTGGVSRPRCGWRGAGVHTPEPVLDEQVAGEIRQLRRRSEQLTV
jgi:hypothetical protein